MKLTFVTVSATVVRHLIKAEAEIAARYPNALQLSVYYAVPGLSPEKREAMVADLSAADLACVDLMGAPAEVQGAVGRGLEACPGDILPYGTNYREFLRLGNLTADTLRAMTGGKRAAMKAMGREAAKMEIPPAQRADMRCYGMLLKYFKAADLFNIQNMLLLLLKEYGSDARIGQVPPPREVAPVAVCDPCGMVAYESFEAYKAANGWRNDAPTLLVLYYAHLYPTDTSGCVSAVCRRLAEMGNILPVAVSGASPDVLERLRALVTEEIPQRPDLILNFMSFRLGAGPMGGDAEAGTKLLSDLGAPYLHPFFMSRRTVEAWQASAQGCTAGEVMISLLLPELDGCIDTIPVGAMSPPVYNEKFGILTEELTVIEERLERLAEMVKGQLRLRQKPNKDKKIALICYNYPPGEDNLFGGAFLDTFASVSEIACSLNGAGYDVSPLTVSDLTAHFTAGKAVNSGRYASGTDGMILYDAKKYKAAPDVTKAWGKAPGDVMTEEGKFLIPGMISGNVFIGLQPARGGEGGDSSLYHDKTLPPHHQYVAFYTWLREEFGADAIVHVGTHGTLEFLKGKEAGMSGDCYPDKLISGIPHIYLYYCGNPAEATIAKRRSHATLVGYQPPVFLESGLYGDNAALSEELNNYRQALTVSPQGAADILARIKELAAAQNLPADPEELEEELYRQQHSLIPHGLHVFGTPYTSEETAAYAESLKAYGHELDLEKVRERCEKNREKASLLDALSGKYIPAKLAGDIYRNPDVLPAGYNLYQFDPKLVPTATAMERGARIAENTVEAYRRECGSYPASVAVVLWGLETSRTQGETFAQILTYLGVRMSPDGSRNRRFEIISAEELGRPRIDVTVNICGFFRDMYPNLIDTLCELLEEVGSLPESAEQNYIKAHAEKLKKQLLQSGFAEEDAKALAFSRIFGPAEGQYGSGITKFFENHDWETEEQVGKTFTDNVSHVYNKKMRGKPAEGLYEAQLKCVDIVSQLRSSNEYEITDLDHYFEYFGGLSKSVELAKGSKAKMYITDTAGKALYTESVERSVARGIRTRMLNPKWIDGMLAHPYHGAQQISSRFENVMGLAATTGAVEDWVFHDLDAKYVEDEALRRRMVENNPHAYMKILEQLMEYSDRGYWDATEEQLEKIRTCYLELENDLEGTL